MSLNGVDIDAHNCVFTSDIVKQLIFAKLTSDANQSGCFLFKRRSQSARTGLDCKVQLTEQPAFFINQSEHDRVLLELNRRRIACSKAIYVAFAGNGNGGETLVVPFAATTHGVCGAVLFDALKAAGDGG
jgi:hypothetical protein